MFRQLLEVKRGKVGIVPLIYVLKLAQVAVDDWSWHAWNLTLAALPVLIPILHLLSPHRFGCRRERSGLALNMCGRILTRLRHRKDLALKMRFKVTMNQLTGVPDYV